MMAFSVVYTNPMKQITSNEINTQTPKHESIGERKRAQMRAAHHIVEFDAEIEAECLEFVLRWSIHNKETR